MRDSKKRALLWEEQDGKCAECGRQTILPHDLLELFAPDHDSRDIGPLITSLLRTNKEFKARWHDDLATIEHKIPKVRNGSDSLSNLEICCSKCNADRGVASHHEFLDEKARRDGKSRRFVKRGGVWDKEHHIWVLPGETLADLSDYL